MNNSRVWFYVPLWCATEESEDYPGEFVATIPDVEEVWGYGDSPQKAAQDLAEKVFFELRAL